MSELDRTLDELAKGSSLGLNELCIGREDQPYGSLQKRHQLESDISLPILGSVTPACKSIGYST